MTSSEWNKLEKYVQRVAMNQAKEIVQQIISEEEESEQSQGQENTFSREVIAEALTRYRTEPEESHIRQVVDWLIKRHAAIGKLVLQDETFRTRHNAIVLEYIISKPMTHVQIEKKLDISDGTFKRYLDIGIAELAEILF